MTAILVDGEKAVYPFIFPSSYGGMGSINCYIYRNGSDYTLIDAGIETDAFEQFFFEQLQAYGIELTQVNRIILTHFHADHIGLVNKIRRLHHIPVYASDIAIPRLKCVDDYLHQKVAFYHDLYRQYGVSDLAKERMAKLEKTLQQKEKIMIVSAIERIGDGEQLAGLHVLAAPGHSPDSICLYDAQTGWLFAGDFLLASGMTSALIDHDEAGEPTNPIAQYMASIKRLETYSIHRVFAGHQDSFEQVYEVMTNSLAKREYKLSKLVAKIAQGHETARAVGEAMYGSRFAQHFTFTISEVIGLTMVAEQQGLIHREWQDGEWHFSIVEK